ncbi:M61 family metallopeptidase [Fimbriimonas ginsengisoli]|uniref:Peptidase M61 domain-containing protein n=1 Tax=Fimbriimonas ginsengisoli Gsoil 348 TaxID=661478 RepID=A0A068NZ50_FIMGI|nr:M61 family metallopeptidase [Fimbriimonas ginsengisoli]AIE87959.1 peptidase M61 domain-containing protein [Fimbriimonas ginsengisoli Gsoil 348]
MHRRIATLALIFVASVGRADLTYRVLPKPATGRLVVMIEIPTRGGETTLQMPRWSPGAYVLSEPGKNVQDFRASDENGVSLPVTNVDPSTWRIGAGKGTIQVVYSVPGTLADETIHYSGSSTYMYVVARKQERCHLRLEIPGDWRVAVGLDPESGGNAYGAKSYDVLADNPVTMGHFLEDHYTSAGRDHTIAMRNPAKSKVDRAHLIKAAKFVSDMQSDFFGGAPYHKYVWHFGVTDRADGAGGLEHLSSTQISLAAGVGPVTVGVMSHEFFHLWNVKRIRSRPLGPFDYQNLPQTGALWWLEGATDYFAHLLLNRYGWFDGAEIRQQIVRNLDRQRARPARMEISPYMASYRVREANGGRGNSDGFQVSYYDTGFLCALCLDTEILSQTGGRRSLDDVERNLWKLCRDDKPGFQEGEIRNQCVLVGGPAMGAFYDRVVMTPGELPVEAQLAKIGLRLTKATEAFADFGFSAIPSAQDKGFLVQGEPRSWDGLKSGDLIVEINGAPVNQDSPFALAGAYRTATEKLKSGDVMKLKIRRGTDELTVTRNVTEGSRPISKVEEDPSATAAAKRLYAIWIAKKR